MRWRRVVVSLSGAVAVVCLGCVVATLPVPQRRGPAATAAPRTAQATPRPSSSALSGASALPSTGSPPRQRGWTAAATEHSLATQAALERMSQGGNAIDAAVCAALVAGVVSPTSSGIGGGGFVVWWSAKEGRARVLDFRETAPRGMDPEPFERRPFSAAGRGRWVGVPGEIKGLFELHSRYGRLPWAKVVAPAVRFARQGFPVGQHLAEMLAVYARQLPPDPGLERVFFAGGRPSVYGAQLRNAPLATVLEAVQSAGPDAFYRGPIARELVETAHAFGSMISLSDLVEYQPAEREPLAVEWSGSRVYTVPLPSAGGVMLGQLMGLFSPEELRALGRGSAAYQHLLAEGMRGSLADRLNYLGDPAVQPVEVAQLLDPARLAQRKALLRPDRTHRLPEFGLAGGGTHHLVTADAEGNFVSLTTTINSAFGAKITTPSGVILNDQLDDFTLARDVKPMGLTESPNRPRPGARPVSSMTPTLVVQNGRVTFAIGGSGGPAIATNVAQGLLNRLVFGDSADTVVTAPRFYVPTRGATLWLEPGADPALVSDLERRGEVVATTPFTKSALQVIETSENGYRAASDPRKHGSSAVR